VDEWTIDAHHSIEDDTVIFDGIILPGSQTPGSVGDPALVWERATGGWPVDPIENPQSGDLILMEDSARFGFALIEIEYIEKDVDGCWDGGYKMHYFEPHVAADPWPLWELTRQGALPFVGSVDEDLWVHITLPNLQTLSAGAITLNNSGSGAAFRIQIADEDGPDSVNIEAVGPWAIQYLPAMNPIDARENMVIILRQGDQFFEVDIGLAVNNVNGQRNLEVSELIGWRCNLGTGQTCAGRTYADVLVGGYAET